MSPEAQGCAGKVSLVVPNPTPSIVALGLIPRGTCEPLGLLVV